MKAEEIRKKLRQQRIRGRTSTLTSAFASAIAPHDYYQRDIVLEVIRDLKQRPNNLRCVFCGDPAEGWDHLKPLIMGKNFSGYGHWLGNLVPCCGDCNASKRGQDWRDFLKSTAPKGRVFQRQEKLLQRYVDKYGRPPISPRKIKALCGSDIKRLKTLRDGIFGRMKQADKVANIIYHKLQENHDQVRKRDSVVRSG